MIPNKEKEGWQYLAVKEISKLLRRITSKHHGDFYCFNCLRPFRTENELKSHEKVCKSKDFCGIAMPSDKDILSLINKYVNVNIFVELQCHQKRIIR